MSLPEDWDDRRLEIKRLIRESQERLRQSGAERAAREAGMAHLQSLGKHDPGLVNEVLLRAILATLNRIEARLGER